MANKAYQFRIYPTEEQKFLFAKTFGCVRLVYNYYLEQKIKLYQKEKKNFSYTKCSSDMTALKKTEDYLFLSDVDSIALQQSLRHLEDAFQNFFSRPASGFPKFKSRRKKPEMLYNRICKRQYFFRKWIFETAEKQGLSKSDSTDKSLIAGN